MNGASPSKRPQAATPRMGASDTTRRGVNKRSRPKITIRCPRRIRELKVTFEQIDDDHDASDTRDETEEPTGSTAISHRHPLHNAHERLVSSKCKSEAPEALNAQHAAAPGYASGERHQTGLHPSWTTLGTWGNRTMPGLRYTLSTPQTVPWFSAPETTIIGMDSETTGERTSRQALEEWQSRLETKSSLSESSRTSWKIFLNAQQ